MPYYRVDVTIIEDEEHYVKAKNKKQAIKKIETSCYGYVDRIDAEKITKEEYDGNKEE
ncbi:MAG: hypothetical protein PHP92_03560 [Candidatus Nanoarchaeia archaeon]|nr:hypothetical protein [Candidatus Nanoarchaeia archaeon]